MNVAMQPGSPSAQGHAVQPYGAGGVQMAGAHMPGAYGGGQSQGAYSAAHLPIAYGGGAPNPGAYGGGLPMSGPYAPPLAYHHMTTVGTAALPAVGPHDFRFCHLGFLGHPWVRIVVAKMLAAGVIPTAIVEEDSAMALKKATWYVYWLEKTGTVPPMVSEQVQAYNAAHPDAPIVYHLVKKINDPAVVEVLASFEPQMITIGTGPILRQPVLDVAPMGVLNVHPSFLPGVRGASPQVHAINRGDPLGVTAHWCDAVLDVGPIFASRPVTVRRGDTLSEVNWAVLTSCAALQMHALTECAHGNVVSMAQPPGVAASPVYQWATEAEMAQAEALLAANEYAGYTSGDADNEACTTAAKRAGDAGLALGAKVGEACFNIQEKLKAGNMAATYTWSGRKQISRFNI